MTRKHFAKNNGFGKKITNFHYSLCPMGAWVFSSYKALIMSSEIIIKDTSTWLVTLTENGFLAWSPQSLDKLLGYFDTFELAKQEILDAITLDPSL